MEGVDREGIPTDIANEICTRRGSVSHRNRPCTGGKQRPEHGRACALAGGFAADSITGIEKQRPRARAGRCPGALCAEADVRVRASHHVRRPSATPGPARIAQSAMSSKALSRSATAGRSGPGRAWRRRMLCREGINNKDGSPKRAVCCKSPSTYCFPSASFRRSLCARWN